MLKFSIVVKNPWAKDVDAKAYNFDKAISKNKRFEAEHSYCGYFLLYFALDTSWRGGDHAGPELELCVFGYTARYKIYDIRHWNYTYGRWMTEQEQRHEYDSYI